MYDDQELGFRVRTKADKVRLEQEYESSKSAALKALKKSMRPELINRLDAIEVFHALTRKDVEKIFDGMIDELKNRLATKSVGLKLDKSVKDYLIEEGYDPKNGARPLRRVIEDRLESALSEALISGEILPGQIAKASLTRAKKIKLSVEKREK